MIFTAPFVQVLVGKSHALPPMVIRTCTLHLSLFACLVSTKSYIQHTCTFVSHLAQLINSLCTLQLVTCILHSPKPPHASTTSACATLLLKSQPVLDGDSSSGFSAPATGFQGLAHGRSPANQTRLTHCSQLHETLEHARKPPSAADLA
jgi:hypothetical protein